MKPSFAALATVAAVFAAGAAQAANAPIEVNLIGAAPSTLSAGISHTLTTAGSFEDIYTLVGYSGPSSVNGTLSTLVLSGTSPDIDISSVTLNGFSFTQRLTSFGGNPDGREQYTLPANAFDGVLTLIVKGTLVPGFDGSSVGTYSANFRVTPIASPVPEPETYALFGAGLLAVLHIARRRRAA
jgi:hypothetical protein